MASIQEMMGSSLIGGGNFDAITMLEGAKAKRNLIIGGVVAVLLIGGGVAFALYKRSKAREAKEARKANRSRSRSRKVRKSTSVRRAARKARKANKAKAPKANKATKAPYRLKPSMAVQTLIFPKPKFTKDAAVSWAQEHDFKASKVDETGQSFRLRQSPPGRSGPKTFRTIPFGESGIKAVVAKKKQYQEATK